MKKNSGFSLVELIVVIAIMAVLVGVLAPAYLKYVEKSRKATDIDNVSEMMEAAVKVAAEEENAVAGLFFHVVGNGSSVTTSVNTTSVTSAEKSATESAWHELVADSYTLKSKEFKAMSAWDIKGEIKNTGAVVWTGCPDEFRTASSAFGAKFSS